MFLEFDPPTKKTVKNILIEWVNKNDWFPLAQPGRPDSNLIKLAAYRFTQGQKDKPYNLIRFELEKSKITPTKYGKLLYKKYTTAGKNSSASSWSEDIAGIHKILVAEAKLLIASYISDKPI
jgi:hypothetical protein